MSVHLVTIQNPLYVFRRTVRFYSGFKSKQMIQKLALTVWILARYE